MAVGVLVILIVGSIAGLINGVFIARFRIPSFMMTLVMLMLLSSTAVSFPSVGTTNCCGFSTTLTPGNAGLGATAGGVSRCSWGFPLVLGDVLPNQMVAE